MGARAKATGGVVLVIAGALSLAFTVFGVVRSPPPGSFEGGPYVVMGAVVFAGVGVVLIVLGWRLLRRLRGT